MDDTDGPVSRRGFLRTAAGATAIAGASGTAAAQKGGSGGGGTKTVQVGPGGNYIFKPGTDEPLYITPGTKVKFVWKSNNHNVRPKSGDWGHTPLENKGFSFTTPPFKKKGKYHYWCDPHKGLGMVGDIVVNSTGQPPGGGGGSSGPSVPKSAKTLGIAAMSFMLSTLGLAYFFMKYGTDFEAREQ